MNDLLTKLLAFLEDLMANPEAAAAFRADPQGTLVAAGLANVTQTDIRAVMPVVVDYAPVNNASVGARVYDTSANVAFAPTTVAPVSVASPISAGAPIAATPAPVSHGGSAHHDDAPSRASSHGGSSHDSGHGAPAAGDWEQDAVIKQISNIVNNYSYTSLVDDRDTVTDMSTNQTIWTNGDVMQFFNNHAMVASGDQAVVADGPVMQDNSTHVTTTTITDSYKVDKSINDSFNKWEQDNHTESNGNTWQQDNSDNSINDSYNHETETDVRVEIEDSFRVDDSGNTDNSKEFNDSFNDTDNSDNSTTIDDSFRVDDSFTVDDSGNTTNTDNSDNSTDISTEIEDSFTVDDSGNTDNSTEIEDSGNTDIEVKDFLNDNTLSSSEDTYSADVHGNAIAVDDAAAAVVNGMDHHMPPV